MPLGPVVASPRLAKHEVVGPENASVRSGANRVHSSGLKVEEDGPGNVFASTGLVVVDVDALELEVRGAIVVARWLNAVLVGDNLPELKNVIEIEKILSKQVHCIFGVRYNVEKSNMSVRLHLFFEGISVP